MTFGCYHLSLVLKIKIIEVVKPIGQNKKALALS